MIHRSLFVVALGSVLSACGGSTPTPATPPPPAAEAADPHGIAADEYIVPVGAVPDKWTATVDGAVAKLEKPADDTGEAVLYVVQGSGREQKSKVYFKSHPAPKEELTAGALAACFGGTFKDGAFHAPPSAKEGRNGRWIVGHVADVAEVDKGTVRIGEQKCALDATRILTPPK